MISAWNRRWCAAAAAALLISGASWAEPLHHGFAPERLRRLDAAIEQAIAEDRLAGAVMWITRDGQPVKQQAYGHSDRAANRPMQVDTIMRIASMSKAVTTVAAMMLYEEGHFLLQDPIAHYLPEFAQPVVAIADPSAPGGYRTEPARRPIRVLDLLCHTAGLTYGEGPAEALYKDAKLHGWYLAAHDETIADVVRRLAQLPLHGQPGETYQYGFSTDVLGRYIEAVSGRPLDQFFAERIFQPLGMNDTYFFLPVEKADRLAPVYGYEDGTLSVVETVEESAYVHGPRKCFGGGAGLVSTAPDYGRFLQMLVNGGELDGVRLLSPRTVALMSTDHHVPGFDWDTRSFGLGFWVLTDLGRHHELGQEGAYGWGSAYYPQYVVDPQNRMTALLMAQLRPTGGMSLNQRFKVLTYQALIE